MQYSYIFNLTLPEGLVDGKDSFVFSWFDLSYLPPLIFFFVSLCVFFFYFLFLWCVLKLSFLYLFYFWILCLAVKFLRDSTNLPLGNECDKFNKYENVLHCTRLRMFKSIYLYTTICYFIVYPLILLKE